jgi:hypothetical protein
MDDIDDVRARTDLDNGWNEALLESVPWCRARQKAKELLAMMGWESPPTVKALF